jgi:hypothetical protein
MDCFGWLAFAYRSYWLPARPLVLPGHPQMDLLQAMFEKLSAAWSAEQSRS